MKPKRRRAIKKKNFKKIRKAKNKLKKAIKNWKKLHSFVQQILIQLKLCVKKRFMKKFKFILAMLRKGRPGKKIGKRLIKTKWASHNKTAAKRMAKCLRKKLKPKKKKSK